MKRRWCFPCKWVYVEDSEYVRWCDSALTQGEFAFDRCTAASHVLMQPQGTADESFECWLIRHYSIIRRVSMRTYDFAMPPALLVGTEYVATVHAQLARLLTGSWPLAQRRSLFPLEPMQQSIQWLKRSKRYPGMV